MGWGIGEKALRLVDGCMGMANIAGTEVVVNGLLFWNRGIDLAQNVLNEAEELIEGGGFADRDVKDLVERGRVVDCGGEEIGLDDVVDVAEVATGFAIAKNMNRLVLGERRDPTRNEGCGCAGGGPGRGAGEDTPVLQSR